MVGRTPAHAEVFRGKGPARFVHSIKNLAGQAQSNALLTTDSVVRIWA